MGRISNAWAALMGKTPEAAQKPMVEVLELEPADRLCIILKDGARFTCDQAHNVKNRMNGSIAGRSENKVLFPPDSVARIVLERQKQSPDQWERGDGEVKWRVGNDTTDGTLHAKLARHMSERQTSAFMEPSGGVGARVVGRVAD